MPQRNRTRIPNPVSKTTPRARKVPERPTNAELAVAVELNNVERLRLEGRLPWVEFHDEGDAIRVFAGDTWPDNRVALARFPAGEAHRRVGEILAPHLKQKVACNWVVGPVSHSPELIQHLRAHGFSCRIHCAGMACDLTKPCSAPPVPDGISISLTDDAAMLEPLTTARRRQRHEGRSALSRLAPQQVWNFTAHSGVQPVGGTTILLGAGVAGVYGVDVLEKFRRRGIATALVHTALVFARNKLNQRIAVLAATGLGRGVYSRLGFSEVCKMSFWKYGKMRQQQNRVETILRSLLRGGR